MVGGPVGGYLADKITHSPAINLKWTFLISAIAMLLFIQLPYDSVNVYLGMVVTLGFGAIIFSQRAIFFAPMDEIGTPREFTGLAMVLAALLVTCRLCLLIRFMALCWIIFLIYRVITMF